MASTLVMNPAAPPTTFLPPSCPSCGHDLPPQYSPTTNTAPSTSAEARIRDLEAQVKLLNSKAAAAVDKLADYEDEVRFLRSQTQRLQQQSSTPADEDGRPKTAGAVGGAIPGSSRLSSLTGFLGRRKISENSGQTPTAPANTGFSPTVANGLGIDASPNYNQSTPSLPPPPLPTIRSASTSAAANPTLLSLQTTLENERTLRQRAESSLQNAHVELEELTAQLFGQANEMVAQERRERVKLEERVKLLEDRERRKGERMERLEERVRRVERVRGMVG